jgi:protein O-GlcNAc transferase
MSDRLGDLLKTAAVLRDKGDLAAAQDAYRAIVREFPQNSEALFLLGLVTALRKQFHAAAGFLLHAIDLNPANSNYFLCLARVWSALQCDRLAADMLARAQNLDRANPALTLEVALAHWKAGDPDAAAHYARIASRLNPRSDVPQALLGLALAEQGDPQGACAAYCEALRINPTRLDMDENLIYSMQLNDVEDHHAINAALREWNRRWAAPLTSRIKPLPLRDSNRKKLRIGWVSPDFRNHSVGRCILPVFQAFDRDRFEIYLYSVVEVRDKTTDAFEKTADAWRDISQTNDEAGADLIRSDRLDVLVDLAVHTYRNRLLVFALKPALVQVTYLGYAGSTGLDAIDYRISNSRLDPPDADLSDYSEKTLMLPGSYLCYRPHSTGAPIADPPALKNGFITFGCLNGPSKLTPGSLRLWEQLLASVPGSRLILHVQSRIYQEKIRAQFADAKIAPDRLEIVPRQEWDGYIQTFNRIDIALNTLGHGAGITACDALWMGVPIVTTVGDTAVRRMCFSMVHDAGHPEWAAKTREDYLHVAQSLAADLPRLTQIRANLRQEIESSPLMDATALARNLEKILTEVSLAAR